VQVQSQLPAVAVVVVVGLRPRTRLGESTDLGTVNDLDLEEYDDEDESFNGMKISTSRSTSSYSLRSISQSSTWSTAWTVMFVVGKARGEFMVVL
jgi:hypothetical protein